MGDPEFFKNKKKVTIWNHFHLGSNLISSHGGSHFVEGHRSMSLH